MSAEIINLRQARKAKARAEKEKRAAENRASFGRTKSQRDVEGKTKKLHEDRLDQQKIEGSEPPDDEPA